MDITTTIITILVLNGTGFWCYKIAQRNNRNTTLAFVLGATLAIWAVIGYYIAGKPEINH